MVKRRRAGKAAIGLATAALWAAAAPAAFAFGAPVEIGGPTATGPGLAAHPAGGVTAAWVRSSDARVVAVRAGSGGATGEAVDLSGEAALATAPAVARAGDSTVVGWVRQSDKHLVARRIDANGALGPVWDVSGQSLAETNGQAALAANASGRVAVAWRKGSDAHVWFRGFDATAGPSAPAIDLTAEPDIALFGTNVQVGIGPDGGAVVTWHRNSDCHIMGRRVTPAGGAGDLLDISLEQDSAIGDTNPTVRVDDGGDATFAWHRDSDHHAVVRRWRADGSLGPVQDLSAESDIPTMQNFGIAALPSNIGVTWQRASDAHVLAAIVGEPAVDVSEAPSAPGAAPAMARSSDGGLAVAWKTTGGHVAVAFRAGSAVPSPGDTEGEPARPPRGPLTPPAPVSPAGTTTPLPATLASTLDVPRRVAVRAGRVRLLVRCDGTAPCSGTLALRAKGRLLGKTGYLLRAGESRAVSVIIRPRGRLILRRARRLRGLVVVRPVGGGRATKRLTITR